MSYDQELKNEWDNNSALAYAREEGERRKAISTARELKKMGIPLNQIAAATEITIEELAAL